MTYAGRTARLLFSEQHAAQSGLAKDGRPELLFDYNQRFLELAQGLAPAHVLIIGGGAYTLPMALLAALPKMQVTVVEIDAGLLPIARRYFGLKANPRLSIIHQDGRAYLSQKPKKYYDLILLDAYIDSKIPASFTSEGVAGRLRAHLATDGIAAMNIIGAYWGRQAEELARLCQNWQGIFNNIELFPADKKGSLWMPQNLILAGQKGRPLGLAQYLRFAPLPIPRPS